MKIVTFFTPSNNSASSRVEKAYDYAPPISRSANAPYYEVNIVFGNPNSEWPEPVEKEEGDFSPSKRSLLSLSNAVIVNDHLEPPLKGSLRSIARTFQSKFPSSSVSSRLRKRDANSDDDLTLQFQKTKCLTKDVVKVKCEDLQCGVRPRAITQQAR